jgi:hypothetical protein
MSDQQHQAKPPRRALRVWVGDVAVIVHPDAPLHEEESRRAAALARSRGTPMPDVDVEHDAGEVTG